MVAAFPVAKLGALFLKQLSKPIANFCKQNAKSSPIFRRYICMPPAQFYNWCEVKAKMWMLNLGRPVSVPVLSEAAAIELGANLLGEGILFTVAAVLLIIEYNRSANKEAVRLRHIEEDKQLLNTQIQELYFATQKQATQINELTRIIYDLDGRVVQKPWKSSAIKKDKKDGDDPPDKPPVSQNVTETTKQPEESSNVILKAVTAIETELWSPPAQKQPSLLADALNHLYKDVYRLPFSI